MVSKVFCVTEKSSHERDRNLDIGKCTYASLYSSHTVPSATEVRNSERVRTERVRRERETDACLKEICLPSLGKHLQVRVCKRPG